MMSNLKREIQWRFNAAVNSFLASDQGLGSGLILMALELDKGVPSPEIAHE